MLFSSHYTISPVSSSNCCQFCYSLSSIAADTPVDDPSSANLLITSLNSLISEVPTITDPLDFCLCLKIPYSRCQQIQADHQGNTASVVREIAVVWYNQSPEPSWEEVVDGFFCHQHNRDAVLVANRRGVDWRPLLIKQQEMIITTLRQEVDYLKLLRAGL